MRKHTTYKSYTTDIATYPRIRTFYHPHPQAAKLPTDLPLLVFIHGLGGSAAQFAPLLTSLVNAAPCLAIDLPGCGLSDFKPDDPKAYTTVAFAKLVAAAVNEHRKEDQKVIFIGHSMGCSIAALLVSSTSPLNQRLGSPNTIIGFVAVCPKASPPTPKQARMVKRLKYLPPSLFDLMRLYDNIGGINSASVTRFVGKDADAETRKLQMRFNKQSKSKVFLRYVTSIEIADKDGKELFPGQVVWSGIKVPLFLSTGENDSLNPPADVEQIANWLTPSDKKIKLADSDAGAAGRSTSAPLPAAAGDAELATEQLTTYSIAQQSSIAPHEAVQEAQHTSTHAFALKTTIFPAPASHGLLYATSTVRVLSGLVQTFVATHVDNRLSLGWQLQHLTTSGKWDVKNLAKWEKIAPITEPIGHPTDAAAGVGVFRAMKTMREIDEKHNPKEFVKHYSASACAHGVAMIVDISHESPVYDPKGLEEGGVQYHKFPTVSKLPPSADEVASFINLIDHLRDSPKMQPSGDAYPTIGVHCHYGKLQLHVHHKSRP